MKQGHHNGTPHHADSENLDNRPSQEYLNTADTAAQLMQSRVALTELQETLEKMEQQSATTQKEMVHLVDENSRLRRTLMDLAQKEACANHFAYHDELTGLPNRRLLVDRFNQAIAQAGRHGKRVVLLFFDLDGFKDINDRHGHHIGDKLLREVAQRLQVGLRHADTASRYGGDEFVVMLPEVDGEEHVSTVEQKLLTRLAQPYVVDGRTLIISVSVGCAAYPVDGKSYSDLIRRADGAMYCAKANGGTKAS